MKLKIGDEILVVGGKDKGRRGKVERIFPKENRILVPGLNMYKKHRKGFPGQAGGIFEFSRPLPIASLALICPNCGKRTRVGWKILKEKQSLALRDKEKIRICKKCGRQIDKENQNAKIKSHPSAHSG